MNTIEKQLLKNRLRGIVKEILISEISKENEFRETLVTDYNRTVVKEYMRKMVQDILDKDIKSMVNQAVRTHLNKVFMDVLQEKLVNDVEIDKKIKQAILPHLKNNFKGVITLMVEESKKTTYEYVLKRIDAVLKNAIELKTSTISEIKHSLNNDVIKEEHIKLCTDSMLSSFPEYGEAILQISKNGGDK